MKRLLVLLMTGTLCFSMVPGNVMAAEMTEDNSEQSDLVELSEEDYEPVSLLDENENESESVSADLTEEESVGVGEDIEFEDVDEDSTYEGLWAEAVDADGNSVDTYTLVNPSEEKTLYVSVHGADSEKVTYEWYERQDDGSYNLISGATASSYTVIANKTRQYECFVQDQYGNSTNVFFDVVVDNNLNAYAKNYVEDIDVSVNEEKEIEVVVDAYDTSELTYQWYYYVTKNNGVSEYYDLPDDGPVCAVLTDETREYWCRVTDQYGNWSTVSFNVRIDNEFYAWASESEFQEQNCNVYVEPNVATTLHVETTAKDMSGITYQWYKWSDEPQNEAGEYGWDYISDATESSYTITTDKKQLYVCQVTDRYGTRYRIEYNIYLEGEDIEPLVPENEGLIAWDADSEPYICNVTKYVGVNEPVALNVAASAGDMSQVTYTWYGNVWDENLGDYSWQVLPDATGASYEVTTDKNANFECVVADGSGFSVSVIYHVAIDNHFVVWPEGNNPGDYTSTDIMFTPGESVALKINVDADDTSGVTYRWSSSYGDDLSEASGSQLVVTPDARGYYYCEVTDQYGNWEEVWFYLNCDNGFKASAEGGDADDPQYAYLSVPYGESVTLKVLTEANDDTKMSYSWYGEVSDYLLTEDNRSSYTTTVESNEVYRCLVDDGYGNQAWIYFFVSVDNQFKAWPEGADSSEEDSVDIAYQLGQPVDLQVNVEGGDTTGITYNWSSSYGDDLSEMSGAQLSVTPQENGYYHCEVSDQYGNCEDVWFYLTYDNGFRAKAEGGEETDPQSAYLYVPYGENVTLNVIAEADDDTKISYSWYGEVSDYLLTEDNRSSYTTTVESYEVYRCLVDDGYGNQEWIYFYVSVDNQFKAWPEGAKSEDEHNVKVLYQSGQPVDLKVNVTAGNTEGITYNWSSSNGEDLSDMTDSLITVYPEENGYYHCVVSDQYGNCEDIWFYLVYDNGFSAVAEGGTDEDPTVANLSVNRGDSLNLHVLTSADDESNLTWTWYGETSDYVLSKENSPTLTVEPVESDVYRCLAEDGYGNEQWVYFYVDVVEICKHNLSKVGAKEPTCTTNGNVEYYSCSVCGLYFRDEAGTSEIFAEATVLPAYGHELTKTELEFGSEVYYTCGRCDKYFSDPDGKNEISKPGWVKSGENWKWRNVDQSFATSTWIMSNGEWYYMSSDGNMLTNGWVQDDKGWCWMGPDGKMTKNKWIMVAREWYYLKDDGYLAINEWAKDSGGWYFMGNNGRFTKNKWIQYQGEWYYLKTNGYMAANEWAKDGTGWCWMDANGMIAKYYGWTKISGELYYFNDAHYRVESSWMKDETGTRWLNDEGKVVKSGWIKVGSDWYYIDSNGYRTENAWAKDSTGWCWMDENGTVTKNKWIQDGDDRYHLNADGYMETNTWAKDSKGWLLLGADGKVVKTTGWITLDDGTYYLNKSYYRVSDSWMKDDLGIRWLGTEGKVMTASWIKYANEWYYVNAKGYRAENAWAKDSTGWCWMDENGKITKSKWIQDKGEWYYLKANGYMAANEWTKDSVGWMYMDASGKITKNKWIKSGGYWYYLKSNGYMATGTLTISGKTYQFDSSGKWIS